jgi:signal transduction histidine kinase
MLRRLLLVVLPLVVALFAALGIPLAANMAQRETQTVYLDRLADAERFSSLTDDALRRGRTDGLLAEIRRYDTVYGIEVAVFAPDGRLLLPSRASFDATALAVRAALETAFAGYRPDRIATIWPWQRGPMVVVEPVGRDTGVIAAVVLVSPTGRLREAVLRSWALLAGLGMLPLLVAIAVAIPLSRWVIRPVHQLDEVTVAIAAGRLDARAAALAGPPELRRLATSFNTMAGVVARTLRRQRTFVSDASHQLRNPLTSLRLAVDNLGRYVTEEGRELHGVALAETEEMGRVVEAMLALTRIDGAVLADTPEPVQAVVAERTPRWRQAAAKAGLTLTVDVPGSDGPDREPCTRAPRDALGTVLDELVGNAVRLSGGTTVTVAVDSTDAEVVVSVRDDGAGLSAEDRASAGDRFWRGRAHQNIPGTGLGLAICRELADAWGGGLSLHEVRPHGLEARLILPAAGPAVGQGLADRK